MKTQLEKKCMIPKDTRHARKQIKSQNFFKNFIISTSEFLRRKLNDFNWTLGFTAAQALDRFNGPGLIKCLA